MGINHSWNIERQRNKVLAKDLEDAKKDNKHDEITSAAANKAASDRKLQELLDKQE